MYWIFGVKFVNLGDSCVVGGDPAMNIIITQVPVLNVHEDRIIIIILQVCLISQSWDNVTEHY